MLSFWFLSGTIEEEKKTQNIYIKFYCFLLRKTRLQEEGRSWKIFSEERELMGRGKEERRNAKTRSSSCAPENLFLCFVVVVKHFCIQFRSFLICIRPNYKMRLLRDSCGDLVTQKLCIFKPSESLIYDCFSLAFSLLVDIGDWINTIFQPTWQIMAFFTVRRFQLHNVYQLSISVFPLASRSF